MTSSPESRWTDPFLEEKRKRGDPLADEVIGLIQADNQKGEIDQIFQMLVLNRQFPNPAFRALSPPVQRLVETYFVRTRTLPDWADPFRMMVAADVFGQHGPKILMLLLCKSLPLCYTCWRGARVLYRTGRLRTHDGSLDSFTRRLMETAQFVVNMLTRNSFEHDGNAVMSAQKVRLIHAVIRYHTLRHPWDADTLGTPINQEDLVGTLLSFGVVIIDGLEQMDVSLTPEERQAYLHLWRVVGHLMGVDADLLTEDEDECRLLMNRILERQAGPSREGSELTDACIDLMNSRLLLPSLKPYPPALVRYFIGDTYADMLEVPRNDIAADSALAGVVQRMDRSIRAVSGRNALLSGMARTFSNELISRILDFHNGAKNEQFYLPSALTDTWQEAAPSFRVPEVGRIDEVIFYLDKLARHFRSQNNPMGLFAAIYKLVTQRVAEGIRLGAFENPVEMEQVDVRFSNRYFEAVNQYFDGKTATKPWQTSFDAARTPMITNQYIFSAANAHITFDLPIVVADVYRGRDMTRFEGDFIRMNAFFEDMYAQMNDNVGRIYRPFGTLVQYFEDRILAIETNYMQLGRDMAWQKSLQLHRAADDAERQRLLTELEEASAAMARQIVWPPLLLRWPLRLIARQEFGTVAHKVDVMLRTALLPPVASPPRQSPAV